MRRVGAGRGSRGEGAAKVEGEGGQGLKGMAEPEYQKRKGLQGLVSFVLAG